MKIEESQAATSELRVEVVRSIREIDSARWDSINAPLGLYWTHRFLTCIESSGVADATYWYLLLHRGQELVATAVLTSIVVSLDLLLPSYMQRLCGFVRRIWPRFLRIRMLFCGIPVSIGKHTLALSENVRAEECLNRINGRMNMIARENGIQFICFKEFVDYELPEIRMLEQFNYIRAYSIPRVQLDIKWPTFADYLVHMRHSYRRMIRQSLNRINVTSCEMPLLYEKDASSGPHLVAAEFRPEHVTRMHMLYLEVMNRTSVKLEVLSKRFFERLAASLQGELILLYLQDKGRIQGAALLGRNGPSLNFLLAGIDYETRDHYQTYFNLLNGIIAYGIDQRFKVIDLGQTTYNVKQRLGGKTEPVYFYLRCLSPGVHFLIRCLNRVLFPDTRLRQKHVFRESEQ